MNITLQVVNNKGVAEDMTFFRIEAIGKAEDVNTSVIYSNGMKFVCTVPFGVLWDKLKKETP